MNQSIENAEELAEELIERGQLKRKDSRNFIKTILERSKTEQTEFQNVVREIVKDIFETLGVATKSDLENMIDRLDQIDQKLSARIRTKSVKVVAPKSVAKKPAKKKAAVRKKAK
jgi:polyhydroxyalkanoate synthesis regulator phasin